MKTQFPIPLLALASLAYAVPAQSTDESAQQLETMVVTAHRIPTSDPVLPVTIVRYENHSPVGVEVLRRLPNFAISQSGSKGGLTQVRVRGSEANHTMVLIDGVEANDPATGSEYNFAHFLPYASSHIEFLAGAQSAIWGSDALAGVINLSTEPVDRVRTLGVEAGSFDTRIATLQIADRREHYYYNAAILDYTTDGTNNARVGGEKDGYDHLSWHLSGGWLGERWRLRSTLRETKTESEFDPLSFTTFLPIDGDNDGEHDELLASASLEVVSERWFQQLQLSYLTTDNAAFANGTRLSTTEGERLKATYNGSFSFNPAAELQLLLEYEEERFDQSGAPSFFGDPNQAQKVDTTSAGLEYLGHVGNVDWSASLRRDHNSDFDDATSYRLAVSYRMRETSRLWANVGTGIKNPSFVERFGFTPNTFIGNESLEPEVNQHVSVGLVQALEFSDVEAEFGITLFHDRLEDEINGFFFDPVLFAFTAVNRPGDSTRKGVEATLSAGHGHNTVEFSWGFVDAEEDDGSTEIRRPRHAGGVRVTHQRERYTIHVAAHYVDDQTDLDFTTFPATRVKLDAYTLLRAHVSFALTDNLEVAARLENLLDEDYEDVYGYQTPGRAAYLQLKLTL